MRAAIFHGAFDIRVEQIPDAIILEPNRRHCKYHSYLYLWY